MSEDNLINDGISVIGEAINAKSARIVVVGTARGGTSMVAGALAKLGLFMGEKAVAPTFEDILLSTNFEQNNLETKLIVNN